MELGSCASDPRQSALSLRMRPRLDMGLASARIPPTAKPNHEAVARARRPPRGRGEGADPWASHIPIYPALRDPSRTRRPARSKRFQGKA